MDIYEEMQKLSDELYDKTGFRMDVDKSIYGVGLASRCEEQRVKSEMPHLPVISSLELKYRNVFNDKLDAFRTDWFTLLKVENINTEGYPSSFIGDEDDLTEMLRTDFDEVRESEIFKTWINNARGGNLIGVRRKLSHGINGRVAVIDGGNPVVEDADEYVMILVAVEYQTEIIPNIKDAFPI